MERTRVARDARPGPRPPGGRASPACGEGRAVGCEAHVTRAPSLELSSEPIGVVPGSQPTLLPRRAFLAKEHALHLEALTVALPPGWAV